MESQSAFFRPGGTLEPGAASYIARKADDQLVSALLSGEYVFLLDSRQKGKSSLVARSILKLREAGVRQVKLDLQRIGANVTPEQWYAGLAVGVGQELGLQTQILQYWSERQAIGPLARFIGVLQDVVLPSTTEPLVIFVDEVDFVCALTFPTDEFFAGIRECFNRRSSNAEFKRLTFCLVGVATPGQLIRNPDISPFNIGVRIDLTDFTLEETSAYSKLLNGNCDGSKLVARVHYWVSGHPYLTQLLCGRIANDASVVTTADVDRLVRTLFLSPESRQREPNLSDVERRMLNPDVPGLTLEERRIQVLELYGRMLKSKTVESVEQNPVVATLRLSGVGLEHDGVLQVRNRVYREVFDETWRRQNLPDAEARRQKVATIRAATITALVAGTILSVMAFMLVLLSQTARERQRAIEQLEVSAHKLQVEGYAGLMASIRTQMAAGQWSRVGELVDRAQSFPGRNWEWGHVYRTVNRQVWKKQFDPGSILLKDSKGLLIGASHNGTYSIDAVSRPRARFDLPDFIEPYARVGQFLICSKLGGTEAACVQLATGREVFRVKGAILAIDPVRRLALVRPEPQGTVIEVISFESTRVGRYVGHRRSVRVAAFLPNGDCLSIGLGGDYQVWGLDGELKARLWTNQESPGGIVVSPNGRLYTTIGGNYQEIPVLGTDQKMISTLVGHRSPTSAGAFSDSSKYLATGSYDGVVRVFEAQTGKMICSFVGHKDWIKSVLWTQNDRALVSLDVRGEARKWVVRASEDVQTFANHTMQANSAALSSDGKHILSSGLDGRVVLRDLTTGASRSLSAEPPGQIPLIARAGASDSIFLGTSTGELRTLKLPSSESRPECRMFQGPVLKLEASNDGKSVLALGPGTGACLVRGPGLNETMHLGSDIGLVKAIAFNPSGTLFALGSEKGVVALFSTSDGKMRAKWIQHKDTAVKSLAFSDKFLASGGMDASIVLYDLQTNSVVSQLLGHSSRVMQLRFSPDQQTLASASFDGTARLWDVRSGRQKAILPHGSWLSSVRYSPDGARVITASDDNTATVWDAELGNEMITLRGHAATVWDAFFSPSGREVLTVSSDGSIKRWQSDTWK